jgi:hypothetical protein
VLRGDPEPAEPMCDDHQDRSFGAPYRPEGRRSCSAATPEPAEPVRGNRQARSLGAP